ncbi:hypothetical protein B0H19DRAFT_1083417 [Mycena capillaripes]|nr:hypothetical protein B0H19DRAFT_1083417 [Mycena capillaripes]
MPLSPHSLPQVLSACQVLAMSCVVTDTRLTDHLPAMQTDRGAEPRVKRPVPTAVPPQPILTMVVRAKSGKKPPYKHSTALIFAQMDRSAPAIRRAAQCRRSETQLRGCVDWAPILLLCPNHHHQVHPSALPVVGSYAPTPGIIESEPLFLPMSDDEADPTLISNSGAFVQQPIPFNTHHKRYQMSPYRAQSSDLILAHVQEDNTEDDKDDDPVKDMAEFINDEDKPIHDPEQLHQRQLHLVLVVYLMTFNRICSVFSHGHGSGTVFVETIEYSIPTDEERELFAKSAHPSLEAPFLGQYCMLQEGDRIIVVAREQARETGYIKILKQIKCMRFAAVMPEDCGDNREAFTVAVQCLRLHTLAPVHSMSVETIRDDGLVSFMPLSKLSVKDVPVMEVEMCHVRVSFRFFDVVEVVYGEKKGTVGFIMAVNEGGLVDFYPTGKLRETEAPTHSVDPSPKSVCLVLSIKETECLCVPTFDLKFAAIDGKAHGYCVEQESAVLSQPSGYSKTALKAAEDACSFDEKAEGMAVPNLAVVWKRKNGAADNNHSSTNEQHASDTDDLILDVADQMGEDHLKDLNAEQNQTSSLLPSSLSPPLPPRVILPRRSRSPAYEGLKMPAHDPYVVEREVELRQTRVANKCVWPPGLVVDHQGHIVPIDTQDVAKNLSRDNDSGSREDSYNWSHAAREQEREIKKKKKYSPHLQTEEEADRDDEEEFEQTAVTSSNKGGKQSKRRANGAKRWKVQSSTSHDLGIGWGCNLNVEEKDIVEHVSDMTHDDGTSSMKWGGTTAYADLRDQYLTSITAQLKYYEGMFHRDLTGHNSVLGIEQREQALSVAKSGNKSLEALRQPPEATWWLIRHAVRSGCG